jgi:prevent-host-death family protein
MTVTIHQAKTHLSRLLQQVERGEVVVVCRGKLPVAKIVPSGPSRVTRPKVGKATSQRFNIPADAFAPLRDEELKQWGL